MKGPLLLVELPQFYGVCVSVVGQLAQSPPTHSFTGSAPPRLWRYHPSTCDKHASIVPPTHDSYHRTRSTRWRQTCLRDVHARVIRGEFSTLVAFDAAVRLIFRNAQRYNMRESDIYRAAQRLDKLYLALRDELFDPRTSLPRPKVKTVWLREIHLVGVGCSKSMASDSLTQSLTREPRTISSLMRHSLARSLTRTHSLTRSLTLTHSCSHSLAHSLTHSHTHSVTH
jgi:hypothetical protein